MMQHIFSSAPWFRARRFGYGTGLPMAWQGWVFMLAHVALMIGAALALAERPIVLTGIVLLIAVLPMPIYARHTEDGWRWRWGRG